MNDTPTILKTLKNTPLFKHCSETVLQNFATQSTIMVADKGQVFFVHEEPAKRFFIIMEGWVKLFRETLDGTQAVIDILPQGYVFGESSIFQNDQYIYSAETVEPTKLIAAPLHLLKSEMDNNINLVREMLSALSIQKRQQDKELEHLTIQNAPQRIGCFLLRLTSQDIKGRVRIQLPYDKSLVAARLGMQAETFSRALSKLKNATGLEIKGATIELDDIQKLISFSCSVCTSEFPCKDLECGK